MKHNCKLTCDAYIVFCVCHYNIAKDANILTCSALQWIKEADIVF